MNGQRRVLTFALLAATVASAETFDVGRIDRMIRCQYAQVYNGMPPYRWAVLGNCTGGETYLYDYLEWAPDPVPPEPARNPPVGPPDTPPATAPAADPDPPTISLRSRPLTPETAETVPAAPDSPEPASADAGRDRLPWSTLLATIVLLVLLFGLRWQKTKNSR